MCSTPDDLCSPELNSLQLLQSLTLIEKPFEVMRWYSRMPKSREIVVKSEWTTSWLWCATFIKPPRTLPALCQSGGARRGYGGWGWGFSLKHWWKEQQRQKSIFAGWMKIPSASKLVVWRSLAAFFLCCFLLWVPFISCQNSSFTVLTLELFIIQIENWGSHPGVDHIQLRIWHHMVVHLLHTLSCNLFYCTSLVPLCMWVSVCVCL